MTDLAAPAPLAPASARPPPLPAQASLGTQAALARRLRGRLVSLSHEAETPHLASCLSCVDLLVALYFGVLRLDPREPLDPNRDRFILSKGHAANALYAVLAERGVIGEEVLATLNKDGGQLPEHPSLQCVPGVEATTGALGHGLPIALGMALAARIQHRPYRCFVVLGDGECNEGSVWEAALLAPALRLDNLVALIDYNKWQGTGRSEQVTALAPLRDKWAAFGWDAMEVDGHDLAALEQVLRLVPNRPGEGQGKPLAIVAHTTKGKGVSFMEDDNNWHYRLPTAEEVKKAHQELGLTEGAPLS